MTDNLTTNEDVHDKASEAAKKPKKKKTALNYAVSLLMKLVCTALALWVIFTFIAGVHICHTNSASPTIRDGEFCLTYRRADLKQGTMIIYKHGNKVKFGRVIAFGGDKVEIFNDYIAVNDYGISENVVYPTSPEGSAFSYPYQVPKNCVFVLNDYRSDISDSRTYGGMATRTDEATPAGEDRDKNYDYIPSYEKGTSNGSARTDTITNTRDGGIAVRLFKWAGSEPLSGGHFTLADSSGNVIGRYTSNSDGIVTMMYNFERGELYTLTQKAAPKGYVGMQKKLCFKVNNDDTISLYYQDGATEWGMVDSYDKKWAEWEKGENGITAAIDVYNKPFNFKIVKVDSEMSPIHLGSAHFALYKQANTTISGYVKNKEPMTGFEDMETVNGEVSVCGGNSGRIIDPGENGAIYFLTETAAPLNYSKLEEDIVFRISAIGVPSMVSDKYNGQLVENEDSYIYTLSVPNVKINDNAELSIKKLISGNFGNKDKEFTFNVTINSAAEGDRFDCSKNGELQDPMTKNCTFTMKNDDIVVISLPGGTDITVSEDNEDYSTTFCLNSGEAEKITSKSFIVTENTSLVVTNSFNKIVPTGVSVSFVFSLIVFILPAVPICCILRYKKRGYINALKNRLRIIPKAVFCFIKYGHNSSSG